MIGRLLAHSARPKRGIPEQDYWEHIEVVRRRAVDAGTRASDFWSGDRVAFVADVGAAAQWHDCGKLAPENQKVLACVKGEKLPVKHEDGGAALLVEAQRMRAALLVASHHRGLPSEPCEAESPS